MSFCCCLLFQSVMQTVKDWLTPSKWTNPWEEEEGTEGEEKRQDPPQLHLHSDQPLEQDDVMETPGTSHNQMAPPPQAPPPLPTPNDSLAINERGIVPRHSTKAVSLC